MVKPAAKGVKASPAKTKKSKPAAKRGKAGPAATTPTTTATKTKNFNIKGPVRAVGRYHDDDCYEMYLMDRNSRYVGKITERESVAFKDYIETMGKLITAGTVRTMMYARIAMKSLVCGVPVLPEGVA